MGYVLGVDLGTTFTAAAVHRDGRFDPVALADGSSLVPSVVFAREDDTFAFGDAANRLAARDPSRVARAFKRRFGDETPLVLGGSPYSADGLTGRLLQWVVDRVRALEGGPPDRIALTHPAGWRGFKLDLLRQAVQHTGLGTEFECLTVSEPHAAAMWYSSQGPLADDQLVAVYDLGGGTFDAAVLRQTSSGFAMLGEPQGIERLGGLDLDEAVFRHVVDTLGLDLDAVDPDDGAVTNGLRRLRVDCTAAKEALSEDTDAAIDVALPGRHTEVRLTRAELESMARPQLAETVVALERALASAGVEAGDLERVLLVGGASRHAARRRGGGRRGRAPRGPRPPAEAGRGPGRRHDRGAPGGRGRAVGGGAGGRDPHRADHGGPTVGRRNGRCGGAGHATRRAAPRLRPRRPDGTAPARSRPTAR